MSESMIPGKNLLASVDNYTAIDIGATGSDPASDSVIVLNAVRVVNGRSIAKFKTIIDPGRKIAAETAKRAGVSPALLAGAPKLGEMLPAFLEFVGSGAVVLHGPDNPLAVFCRDCEKIAGRPFENPRIDTAELAGLVFPDDDAGSLDSLSKALFADNGVINKRVDTRADVAAKCYEYLKLYCVKYGIGLDPVPTAPKKTEAADASEETAVPEETVPPEGSASPEKTAGPGKSKTPAPAAPEKTETPAREVTGVPEKAAAPEKIAEAEPPETEERTEKPKRDNIRVIRSEDLQRERETVPTGKKLRILLILMTVLSIGAMVLYAVVRKSWVLFILLAMLAGYVACCIAITVRGKKKK